MGKRLILTSILLCGLLCAGTAEARVCLLGEAGCESWGNIGPDDWVCSKDYKACTDPRVGATYCGQKLGSNTVALYKDEDCCATLPYYSTKRTTPSAVNKYCLEEDNEVGYGRSCRGGKSNVTYWEFCGCGYGFVDTDPDVGGSKIGSIEDKIKDEDEREVPYDARCDYDPEYTGKCKLAVCNAERRWYHRNSGEWCVYRMPTRCGGLGCKQLYDCDNENDYYRSDELTFKLTDDPKGSYNFIAFSTDDPWSNEKDKAKDTYTAGPGGKDVEDREYREYEPSGTQLPYGKKTTYDEVAEKFVYERYNLTNKIVCGYEGNAGTGRDLGGGKNCNNVINFCFKWNGCNATRGWYDSDLNAGVLYGNTGIVYGDYEHPGAYEYWMNKVERDPSYNVLNYRFETPSKARGEHFDMFSDNYKLRENFFEAVKNPGANKFDESLGTTKSACGIGDSACEIIDRDAGCTYVTHACHKSSRNCYKRIGCSNENRFYYSFINAAGEAYINNELKPLSMVSGGLNGTQYNILYNSSLNGMYWSDFYKADENGLAGLEPREIYPACIYEINACNDTPENNTSKGGTYGGGCYRKAAPPKKGCIDNFEDIRNHELLEKDWLNWFLDWRPICNDNTRCYQASSCDLVGGSYSSAPNTSFFITIHSTATMSTCYRGAHCHELAGAYSSTPNDLFFEVINSSATGSLCYRGQNCNRENGAYSSTPNTSFFITSHSEASTSLCYRGEECAVELIGAYVSEPNTEFFKVIASYATGSTCYRGEDCAYSEGAYSSYPNTSFFVTTHSEASTSLCYRGKECAVELIGAYSSEPNTQFFDTISSYASGSTCYRGEDCAYSEGAYSSYPNTVFFTVIDSYASGSTCYRAECCLVPNCELEKPNTSFFESIYSAASNFHGDVACYRAPGCNEPLGAYSSVPNTSFFITVASQFGAACKNNRGVCKGFDHTKTSICYRSTECYAKTGAYSSTPNTSFFFVIESLSSGSKCYRGQNCYLEVGAYSSTPNTSFFFEPLKSIASGSECYRINDNQICNNAVGSYRSNDPDAPLALNTSYFHVVYSLASGTTCYRTDRCHFEVGAYSTTPNTSFFDLVTSAQSWKSVCYRAHGCHYNAGARQASEVPTDINTSYFLLIESQASGSTCYRGDRCDLSVGAYSVVPNTSFFITSDDVSPAPVKTVCYRGEECRVKAGAYTTSPNTSFFSIVRSYASGSICYRVKDCAYDDKANDGPCTAYPDTAFFTVDYETVAGYTCTKPTGCKLYNFNTNTAGEIFFNWSYDTWEGISCPYIVEPLQGYNDINYCIYNRAVVPSPDSSVTEHTIYKQGPNGPVGQMSFWVPDLGSSQWKLTKGVKTKPDTEREPQCTQVYENDGPITKDECGNTLTESDAEVTAYIPINCNDKNGWSEDDEKMNSCYFNATSSTIHAIMFDGYSIQSHAENMYKFREDDLTCYKYTTPKWTKSSFTQCAFNYTEVDSNNHPEGAPSGYGGTNDTMAACSDSTKGDAKVGMGLACGDYQKSLYAYYPSGCNSGSGWYDKVTSSDDPHAVIDGAINETYFSRRYVHTTSTHADRTCFDQECYQPVAPRCTASSTIYDTVAIPATGGSSTCSTGTITARYAIGCNTSKHYYSCTASVNDPNVDVDGDGCLNIQHFKYSSVTINEGQNCGHAAITCYFPTECDYEAHPYWCNTITASEGTVSCALDNGCKSPANTQYFETTSESCVEGTPANCTGVAIDSKCPNEGNSSIFTWKSTSTTSSIQKDRKEEYTAIYPSGCKTSNGYFATSLTDVCNTSYFKFGSKETATACEHSVACRHYDGCAQNLNEPEDDPAICYVTTRTERCSGVSGANCSVAHKCKSAPNTTYFTTDSKYIEALGDYCTYATGAQCTDENPKVFTHRIVGSISCSSPEATNGSYFAYAPFDCNTNEHYYESSTVNALDYEGIYYQFGSPITASGCGYSVTCREFQGCVNKEDPNTCFLQAVGSFYEPVTNKHTYCKYKCKPTADPEYFISSSDTSKGITCAVATEPRCPWSKRQNYSEYTWRSTSISQSCNQFNDDPAMKNYGSMTSYYIAGCASGHGTTRSPAFEYEEIGFGSDIIDCNPNEWTCYKASACNVDDGYQSSPCPTGYDQSVYAQDGLTCYKCSSNWYIDNLIVYMDLKHAVDVDANESLEVDGLSYKAILKNGNVRVETDDITYVTRNAKVTTKVDTSKGNVTGPIVRLAENGDAEVASGNTTLCEKEVGTGTGNGEDTEDYKCAPGDCTAAVSSSSIKVEVEYDGKTLSKTFSAYSSLLCEDHHSEIDKPTCSDYGYYSSKPSGWTCTKKLVIAEDAPCYECHPNCPSGYYDDQPDSDLFYYTSSTLSDSKKCYKANGCVGSLYHDEPSSTAFKYTRYDYHGYYCYQVDGCNADNGYTSDTCESGSYNSTWYHSVKECHQCYQCCPYGTTEVAPEMGDYFLFNIRETTCGNKTCYQATSCKSYANSYSTDYQRTMTNKTCGVNLPNALSVKNNSYAWYSSDVNTTYFEATTMYAHPKSDATVTVTLSSADVACLDVSNTKLGRSSSKLTTWNASGYSKNCPGTVTSVLYSGQTLFGGSNGGYETDFVLYDSGTHTSSHKLAEVKKSVCLNGCPSKYCEATCEAAGYRSSCNGGEVGTPISVNQCGVTLSCYSGCGKCRVDIGCLELTSSRQSVDWVYDYEANDLPDGTEWGATHSGKVRLMYDNWPDAVVADFETTKDGFRGNNAGVQYVNDLKSLKYNGSTLNVGKVKEFISFIDDVATVDNKNIPNNCQINLCNLSCDSWKCPVGTYTSKPDCDYNIVPKQCSTNANVQSYSHGDCYQCKGCNKACSDFIMNGRPMIGTNDVPAGQYCGDDVYPDTANCPGLICYDATKCRYQDGKVHFDVDLQYSYDNEKDPTLFKVEYRYRTNSKTGHLNGITDFLESWDSKNTTKLDGMGVGDTYAWQEHPSEVWDWPTNAFKGISEPIKFNQFPANVGAGSWKTLINVTPIKSLENCFARDARGNLIIEPGLSSSIREERNRKIDHCMFLAANQAFHMTLNGKELAGDLTKPFMTSGDDETVDFMSFYFDGLMRPKSPRLCGVEGTSCEVDKKCSDYNANYLDEVPEGSTCTLVPAAEVGDLRCYKDCKSIKTLRIYLENPVTTSKRKEIASIVGKSYTIILNDGTELQPSESALGKGTTITPSPFRVKTITKTYENSVYVYPSCKVDGSCTKAEEQYCSHEVSSGTGGVLETCALAESCEAYVNGSALTISQGTASGTLSKTFNAGAKLECRVGECIDCQPPAQVCSDFNTSTTTYYDKTEKDAKEAFNLYTCTLVDPNEVGGLECYTCGSKPYEITVNTKVLREEYNKYDVDQYIYSATMDNIAGVSNPRFNVILDTNEDEDIDVNVENSTLSIYTCIPHSGYSSSVCDSSGTYSQKITSMKLKFNGTDVYTSSSNLPFYNQAVSGSGEKTLTFTYNGKSFKIIPIVEGPITTTVDETEDLVVTTSCKKDTIFAGEQLGVTEAKDKQGIRFYTKCTVKMLNKPTIYVNTINTSYPNMRIVCDGTEQRVGYTFSSLFKQNAIGYPTADVEHLNGETITDNGTDYKIKIENACHLIKLEIENAYNWEQEIYAQGTVNAGAVVNTGIDVEPWVKYGVNDGSISNAIAYIKDNGSVSSVPVMDPKYTIVCDGNMIKTYSMKDHSDGNSEYRVTHSMSGLSNYDMCVFTLDSNGEVTCKQQGLYDETGKNEQLAAGNCCRPVNDCYDCQAPDDYTVKTGSGGGSGSTHYWIKCPKPSTVVPTIPQKIKLTSYDIGNGGTIVNPITCQGTTSELDITAPGSNGSNEFCVYKLEPYPFKGTGGLSDGDTFWSSGEKLNGDVEYKCYRLKIDNAACNIPTTCDNLGYVASPSDCAWDQDALKVKESLAGGLTCYSCATKLASDFNVEMKCDNLIYTANCPNWNVFGGPSKIKIGGTKEIDCNGTDVSLGNGPLLETVEIEGSYIGKSGDKYLTSSSSYTNGSEFYYGDKKYKLNITRTGCSPSDPGFTGTEIKVKASFLQPSEEYFGEYGGMKLYAPTIIIKEESGQAEVDQVYNITSSSSNVIWISLSLSLDNTAYALRTLTCSFSNPSQDVISCLWDTSSEYLRVCARNNEIGEPYYKACKITSCKATLSSQITIKGQKTGTNLTLDYGKEIECAFPTSSSGGSSGGNSGDEIITPRVKDGDGEILPRI